MITDINNTLEALKESLEGIDSAKRQVEETVDAYSKVGISIKEYSSKLQKVSDNLSDVIELVRNRNNSLTEDSEQIIQNLREKVSKIIDLNKTTLDSAKSDFELKTKNAIKELTSVILNLETNVKNLETFKEEIKKSFSSQEAKNKILGDEIEELKSEQEATIKLIKSESKKNRILTIVNIVLLVAVIGFLLLTLPR